MTELVVVAVIVAAMGGEPSRLRAHFAQVDRELQARDVSHLTVAQRNARATHIVRLREYAAAGVFPKNTHHPGAFVPYFVDDVGTRCAMAYLIEQSGAGDLVRRVAAHMNYAYVPDIAGDPELGPQLRAWLEANGLTIEEAARIQPAYDGGPCFCPQPDPIPPTPVREVSGAYSAGSGAAILSGLATLALNGSLVDLGVSRRAAGWVGVGVGALGLTLGAVALGGGDGDGTLGLMNGGVGALAFGLGLHAILSRPAQVPTATAARSVEDRVTASPVVGPGGNSGVMLNIKF